MKAKVWMGVAALLVALVAVGMFGRIPERADAQVRFAIEQDSLSADMDAAEVGPTLGLDGKGGASVVITGTWAGTITPQVSVNDGTTYVGATFYEVSTGKRTRTVTANGTFAILGVAGCSNVRINMTSYTSGTATAKLRVTKGEFAIPTDNEVTVFKSIAAINAVSSATAVIWTPTTGTKFRLKGISLASTVATRLTFSQTVADTALGLIILPQAAVPYPTLDFGEGLLGSTVDGVLAVRPTADTSITGCIWGTEE